LGSAGLNGTAAASFFSSLAALQYAWRGWILGALFAVLAWARWHSQAPLVPAALVLVAAGSAYRLHAGRFIPGHSNSLALAGGTLALRGPYRYGRHPLYLSNLAVIGGLILFAGCLPLWGACALFLVAAIHHAALARAEEAYLIRAWGQAYADYLRATPRWLGLPRDADPSASAKSASGAEKASGLRKASGPGNASGQKNAAAGGDALRTSWMRQGGNLGKTLACALILWALAGFPR
jgi:protein-S-isoprenylcysteine O-methyltransferase Ste14